MAKVAMSGLAKIWHHTESHIAVCKLTGFLFILVCSSCVSVWYLTINYPYPLLSIPALDACWNNFLLSPVSCTGLDECVSEFYHIRRSNVKVDVCDRFKRMREVTNLGRSMVFVVTNVRMVLQQRRHLSMCQVRLVPRRRKKLVLNICFGE